MPFLVRCFIICLLVLPPVRPLTADNPPVDAVQLVSSWEGTWQSAAKDGHGGELKCLARQLEGTKWQATFRGYCNKQFVYEVDMSGVQQGERILFSGEADLGENEGKYHWTGQIEGDKFTGSYQSDSGKRGGFEMKRVQPAR